jgi:hypothetical protein
MSILSAESDVLHRPHINICIIFAIKYSLSFILFLSLQHTAVSFQSSVAACDSAESPQAVENDVLHRAEVLALAAAARNSIQWLRVRIRRLRSAIVSQVS